jgi:hypothetical protein
MYRPYFTIGASDSSAWVGAGKKLAAYELSSCTPGGVSFWSPSQWLRTSLHIKSVEFRWRWENWVNRTESGRRYAQLCGMVTMSPKLTNHIYHTSCPAVYNQHTELYRETANKTILATSSRPSRFTPKSCIGFASSPPTSARSKTQMIWPSQLRSSNVSRPLRFTNQYIYWFYLEILLCLFSVGSPSIFRVKACGLIDCTNEIVKYNLTHPPTWENFALTRFRGNFLAKTRK